MSEFDALYIKISCLLKNDQFNKLNSHEKRKVDRYLIALKTFLDKAKDNDRILNNRICNDTIFTELVFDMILKSYNSDDKRLAFSYLFEETVRFNNLNKYLNRYRATSYCMTQDCAIETLVRYNTSYMKSIGEKEKSKFGFDDLNLSDDQMKRLACLVIYPEELELEEPEVINKLG